MDWEPITVRFSEYHVLIEKAPVVTIIDERQLRVPYWHDKIDPFQRWGYRKLWTDYRYLGSFYCLGWRRWVWLQTKRAAVEFPWRVASRCGAWGLIHTTAPDGVQTRWRDLRLGMDPRDLHVAHARERWPRG